MLRSKASVRFEVIHSIVTSAENHVSVSFLCYAAGVSRSGYYSWVRNREKRAQRDEQDRLDFDKVLQAYSFKGYDKGSRGIHMRLLHMGIRMNRKKICRLMNKYGLKCPIRKANPYRRMAKALRTNVVAKNILNREFKKYGPRKILLTDITYIRLNDAFIYLSVITDAYTKQCLSYALSESLEVDFVLETVERLIAFYGDEIRTDCLIHSDQGFHYTSIYFRKLLNDAGLRQSMSRKGNCWDNAPQESFFGHMKDELRPYIKQWKTFDDVKTSIDNWMDYYNNYRYQWDLAKLSPNEYYRYIQTGIYPDGMLV